MPSESAATECMLAKYRDLISEFAEGQVSAQDFESAYLQAFKPDMDQVPGHEFDVLERLFFAVDDYVADPVVRENVGGLSEKDLRARAQEARDYLYRD